MTLLLVPIEPVYDGLVPCVEDVWQPASTSASAEPASSRPKSVRGPGREVPFFIDPSPREIPRN